MVKNFSVKHNIIHAAIWDLARRMAIAIYWSEHPAAFGEKAKFEEQMEGYDHELADWLKQIKRWKMPVVTYRDCFDRAVEMHLSNLKRERGDK